MVSDGNDVDFGVSRVYARSNSKELSNALRRISRNDVKMVSEEDSRVSRGYARSNFGVSAKGGNDSRRMSRNDSVKSRGSVRSEFGSVNGDGEVSRSLSRANSNSSSRGISRISRKPSGGDYGGLDDEVVEERKETVEESVVLPSPIPEARSADEGLWVLRKMGDFGCQPDSTMYNVVIGLFCERGDLDRAMGLMRELESCDLCPDMITYMSMLKGFCFAGRLEDACQLFKTMKSHGCVPNLVAYSALFDGLCRAGSFERALEFLGEMEKEGGECTPNVIIHQLSRLCVKMASLCREGYIDKAFKRVNDVVVGGQVSKDECYSSLVISLLWIQRFEEAEKLFRWMLGSVVRPDGFACTVLLKDLCLKGRFFEAFGLYEDVLKKGFVLTIDSDIYSALLLGLCQENRVEEVGKLANYMVEKGVTINTSYIDNIHKHLKGSIEMESLVHLCKMGR
uniref:Pentatricopeptide repeat-containing protein n=1 Tax=Chenopodium quinoa TaxID=63459 RepID=A0A803MVE3_CHEQI